MLIIVSGMSSKNAFLEDQQRRCKKVITKLEALYPNPKLALDFSNPLELLVALILAAQYRDTEVNKLTANLFRKYRTAAAWASTPVAEIHAQIRHVMNGRRKAQWIHACCEKVVKEFNGVVPYDFDVLLTFPGIGRKTANVLLGNAFGKQTIGVDRHVQRVSQRLGFTKNNDPDKIEANLMQVVPVNKRTKYCLMIQLHGREVCTAPTPKCSTCKLAVLCPYSKSSNPKQ